MTEQGYYANEGMDAAVEQPERQLVVAVHETDKIIIDLDALSEKLAKRLEPILAHRPEKASDVGSDRASGAPLADEILRQNDRLNTVAQRLRYLLDCAQV